MDQRYLSQPDTSSYGRINARGHRGTNRLSAAGDAPIGPVRRTQGADVPATEFIPLSEARDFTKVYANTILSLLA